MNIIDAHCHLDFESFDEDREAVIRRARDAGVVEMIIPGVTAEHWQRIAGLCTHPNLHACYGLHPCYVDQHQHDDLVQLEQRLSGDACVALGECGLDYREGQPDHTLQLACFNAQLEIAERHSKPVVIHAVRATEDVILVLRSFPKLTGMVHSYSGSLEQAMQLIDMGFYISLGGSVTHTRANRVRKVATGIPSDALLIETDAPDQPDVEHTGMRNEPAYLCNVLQCLAQLREEPPEKIAEATLANTRHLFGI